MSPTPRRVVPLVLVSAVLVVAHPTPGRACDEPRPRHCLAPSGEADDTELLQVALDRCAGARRPCTVSLCEGVFPTRILRVKNFRGTLRGAGPDRTILRALPDLEVSKTTPDFYREDPFSEAGPWPYLVQFVEGKARILDLGIEIPAPGVGSRPTDGWYLFDIPFYGVKGALLFTGRKPVDFDLRHVRVAAEAYTGSDDGTTTYAGAYFEGLLFDADAPEPYPVFPVRGSYRVTDSEFVGVLRGTPLAELAGANVLLARNSYRASTAVDVIDADRSHVAILANRWDVNTRGVQVQQNMDGLPSRGSAIQVSGNEGRIVPYYLGDGLSYVDPFDPSYDPGGTSLRVSGNRWSLGDASLPATSGLSVVGAARLRILDNHMTGRVVSGVIVDQTTGCRVGRNAFDWETAGEEPDLRLGRDTSRCLVAVGLEDTVVDEGAENQVFRP
jgi:hypothetical protein